jgi:hypothetical protein
MTCPVCEASVGRMAFLGASGLSGIVCEHCGAKLAATYESRIRLNGGGLLVGTFVGRLAGSLGAGLWLALPIAFGGLIAWFWFRTERIILLRPSPPSITSIL